MNLSRLILQQKNPFLKMFGSSMSPLLLDGDIVYVKKIIFSKIKVNDLITCRKSERIFTHRVIYRTDRYLISKGDNNAENDGRIFKNQIIGKVYQIKRNGKIINPENIYLLQSLTYFQEIIKIKTELEKYNVEYLFLKGLPLHLYYEGSYPRRIYQDCDILINRNKLNLVDNIFLANNYIKESIKKPGKNKKFIDYDLKEINYFKIVRGVKVILEIHLEVTFLTHEIKLPFPKLQRIVNNLTQDFLETRKVVLIQGFNLPILETKRLITYLLLHFFTHNFSAIPRIELVFNIINKSSKSKNSEWRDIYDITDRYRLTNFILPGIHILYKYYGVVRPYQIAQKCYNYKLKYALFIYRVFCSQKYLFDKILTAEKEKLKRAFLIFFLYDENIFIKTFYVINPRIILHLFYSLLSAI